MALILVQHASGPHEALLDVVEEYHSRLCQSQGASYVRTRGLLDAAKAPYGDKVVAIRRVLNDAAEGDVVLWLDTDAVWADPRTRMDSVLGESLVAMVLNKRGRFNAGSMWLRCCPEIKEVLCRAWENPEIGEKKHWFPFWDDQERINDELGLAGIPILALDSRFNSYAAAATPPTEPIVVKAWHYKPDKLVAGWLAEVVRENMPSLP